MKTLYTAVATATGGREGRAVSSDGALDVTLALPRELGGSGKLATNPEQLFAAGYSACFENAIRHVARATKVSITESSVTGRVGISANPSGGFVLSAALDVSLPGIERDTALALIAKAHEVCPYSNATRGNLDVQITLI
ncbi:organic hydroperoxide resistance protein [Niveibacterium sp. 24ML]|uniref:organic hydroperoxide resistance protein n=1 Tax=Niveibacterium sp. 24ML TaxID=2985512 RepID=UPI002271386B|nr:organic hydroperoxide resistance protein [Niveibacterium sp. 24ML]MCX9154931.1 organic hydroperoxide resistance protein [Niveibacterium sp. 24ML]